MKICSGNPLPTVKWFLNGMEVDKLGASGGRYRLLDQGQGLEIQPSSLEDIGLWTCEAHNSAGTSTADISLDVWGSNLRENMTDLACLVEPTVRVIVEDVAPMKPIGESITLLCEVHGNPQPVISWSMHEQTIIPSPGRVHISKGGQRLILEYLVLFCFRLEIPRLRSEDAGEYYCVAQNEVGSASDFVAVEIIGKFQIIGYIKKQIQIQPSLKFHQQSAVTRWN